MMVKRLNQATLFWLFAILITWSGSAVADDDLAELAEVEKKITKVVDSVMESCVAVSDFQGFGSGVIVSSDGLILTAGHVMTTNSEYRVFFPSGKQTIARPVGKNLSVDAGMMKIVDPGPWPFVPIAEKDPKRGDWVVSLGHSGGYELGRKPPVRSGRVLRKRGGQILTDAVLIGGDSGGPLFNLDGEVVGIHSSIGDSIAQNRHVPVSTFKLHWDRMLAGESWGSLPELARSRKNRGNDRSKSNDKARIGITVAQGGNGAVVTRVYPNSPAQRAGIRPGDIITKFDGQRVARGQELIDLIATKRPDEVVNAEFERGGFLYPVQIRLESVND